MSARSGNDWVYNNGAPAPTTPPAVASGLAATNGCVAPATPNNWTWTQSNIAWVNNPFVVPASELFATITLGTVNVGVTTPIRLWSVTLPILAASPGWFELWITSSTENGGFQMAPAPRFQVPTAITTATNIVLNDTAVGFW